MSDLETIRIGDVVRTLDRTRFRAVGVVVAIFGQYALVEKAYGTRARWREQHRLARLMCCTTPCRGGLTDG